MTSGKNTVLLKWLIVLLTGSFLLTGCFLKPKKKSGKNSGSTGINLIDKTSIFMDRVGDGDSALVQFKTLKTAKCQLEFYSQSAEGPTKEQPGTAACENPAAGKSEFAEKLPGLRTDTLYYVVLVVYESTSDAGNTQRLTIKETPNTDTIIVGDGNEAVKFASINVARLNVPLRTAEFHRHKFETPIDVAGLKATIAVTDGCKSGVPPGGHPLSTSNTTLPIDNLATRDFAAGTSGRHPEYPDRLQISYGGVNELMEKWTLLYTENNKDHSVVARPVSRILNLEMQSETAMAFGEAQLAEAADPLKIDPKKPLKLNWTTGSTLLENTYITVQIGRADTPKSIYCSFAASKRTAEVPATLLEGLDDGRHVILIEMAAHQIWLRDSWLITTYDWRSGRIEK